MNQVSCRFHTIFDTESKKDVYYQTYYKKPFVASYDRPLRIILSKGWFR